MPSEHLSVDEFFTQLSGLFEANSKKSHGSVFLSQKRSKHAAKSPAGAVTTHPTSFPIPNIIPVIYGTDIVPFTGKKGQTDTLADLHPATPLPIIVRATNGDSKDKIKSKVKLSTVVQSDDLEAFYTRYAEVCRAGMSALKKRDRSGRKKKAKKRKGAAAEGEKKG